MNLRLLFVAVMAFLVGFLVGEASAHEADWQSHVAPEVLRMLPKTPLSPPDAPPSPSPASIVVSPVPPAHEHPRANEGPLGPSRAVSSTAYCLTGTMASGKRVYTGAVAMNGQPFGSRWKVLSGSANGRTLTVEDRIGHGSGFDIAMPGNCAGARAYGRQQIRVQRVG